MQDPNGAEDQPVLVPVDVLDALAAAVACAMPTLIGRIPPEPAAQLGRLGVAANTAPPWPGGVADTTPPWPGDYRLRVHVTGRDEREAYDHRGGGESYRLIVWAAPPGPQVVYKRSDQLGYSLRGESAPPRRPRPELAYRWVRQSPVSEAATITVVTGMDVPEALQAFGANPDAPVSMTEIRGDYDTYPSWVAVLAVDGAVVAVEDNGFRGSHQDILEAVSRRGRAASMYWNVNAVSRLSLAEGGELLAAFEPGLEDPQVNAPVTLPYLKDLDLDDYRDKIAKCLVAVERFTGYAVRAEDLDRIESRGSAYLIPSR